MITVKQKVQVFECLSKEVGLHSISESVVSAVLNLKRGSRVANVTKEEERRKKRMRRRRGKGRCLTVANPQEVRATLLIVSTILRPTSSNKGFPVA